MQMDNSASEALEAQPELASCRKADCVVLTTDHSAFDYAAIAKESRLIVDTRNAFREFRGAKIIPLGTASKHDVPSRQRGSSRLQQRDAPHGKMHAC